MALVTETNRNKYFQALLNEGMNTTPIGSHWQGASRLAHALLAGLELRDEDKNSREALPAILGVLSGGQSAPASAAPTAAPTSAPAPVVAALNKRPPSSPNDDAITPAATPQDYINRAWGGLTPQGRDIATRTVLGEAGNQGPTGMAGVADVMRNRAINGGYGGNTMDSVAMAKGQFEPWMTDDGRKRMQSYKPDSQAYQGAQAAVDSAAIGSRPDVTGGATYFYAPKAQSQLAQTDGRPIVPSFAAGREPSAVIGGHSFYQPQTQMAQAQAPQAAPPAAPSGQRPGMNEAQLNQIRQLASHPNPKVREFAAGLAQQAIVERFKSPDYEIKFENGVTIATNKKDPRDQHVITNPAISKAIVENKANEAYATTRATKQAEKDIAKPEQDKQQREVAGIVTTDIDRAIHKTQTATLPVTGATGPWIAMIGGTAAHDVRQLVDTVKANVGFDALNKMRQASPTGGALGSITEKELYLLQATVGNLEQSQSQAQFLDNLRRVKNAFNDVIHGQGKGPPREKLSFNERGETKTIGGKNYIKRGNQWFEE